MLPPLGTSRPISRAGLVPPPITETQNVSRWNREGRAPWALVTRRSVLLAWDAGSLNWVKFCHGNKHCQPPPDPPSLRAAALLLAPRNGPGQDANDTEIYASTRN
jgi:hypothetical protein